MKMEIKVLSGRGSVNIVQQPSGGNRYELIIEFDDNLPSGPAWYEVQVLGRNQIAQVQEEWVVHYNGPGNGIDTARAITADSQGNGDRGF